MKNIICLLFILFASTKIYAQDDKTVTLNASAIGKTEEIATQAALRSAVEQSFGTFISANTQIVNDALIKDEIVSVSNGNIQKFDLVSKVILPDSSVAVTITATVSITKMSSFVESKGFTSNFKGNLFAFNINAQILNEQNETKSVENICKVLDEISFKSFDYKLTISDPVSTNNGGNERWSIRYFASVFTNANFKNYPNFLFTSLEGMSMKEGDVENYISLGKNIYPITLKVDNKTKIFYFRSQNTIQTILKQISKLNDAIISCKISNGVESKTILDKKNNIKGLYDGKFRFIFYQTNSIQLLSLFRKPVSGFGSKEQPGGLDILEPEKNGIFYNEDYKIYLQSENLKNYTLNQSFDIHFPNIHDYYSIEPKYIYEWNYYLKFDFLKKINSVAPPSMKPLSIQFRETVTSPFNRETINFKRLGLVIAFNEFKSDEEVVRIYFSDEYSLDEIKKITGYSIIHN
jgi:hypothetical protein